MKNEMLPWCFTLASIKVFYPGYNVHSRKQLHFTLLLTWIFFNFFYSAKQAACTSYPDEQTKKLVFFKNVSAVYLMWTL